MARLERRGHGSLGGGGSSGGVQDSLPEGSHFIQGTHPFPGLLSHFHPGQSLGAGSGVSAPKRSDQIGSASFTGLLQPVIYDDEGVGVVVTNDRPFPVEPTGVQNTVQDGDYPVHSVVSPQGGLDGLLGPQRCIFSNSSSSGIQEISQVHDPRECLPILGPLFRSLYGPAGLRAGHGSSFKNSSQSWREATPLSGRLANSGVLPGAGYSCSEDSSSLMQPPGDCRQLGEVPACSNSEPLLSGSPFGHYQFPGFSSPETSRQAALNWRRVSVLRDAACKILAGVLGGSVLSNSADSGRLPEDAVVAVHSSQSLGSGRSGRSGSVVPGDWSQSSLVDGPRAGNFPR